MYTNFSDNQMRVLNWWTSVDGQNKVGIICDGATRSGKSYCTGISFINWGMLNFINCKFAICGKSTADILRNVLNNIITVFTDLEMHLNKINGIEVIEFVHNGVANYFYLIGQENIGKVKANDNYMGIFFDDVTLLSISFVQKMLKHMNERTKLWFTCTPGCSENWFYTNWILKANELNLLYVHLDISDNLMLSQEDILKYSQLYKGIFYDRFILGKWS